MQSEHFIPHSPKRRFAFLCAFPALFVFSTLLVSCNKEESVPPSTRNEPWKKDQALENLQREDTLQTYELVAGQSLQFTLPTRKHQPRGVLSGLSGEIFVSLLQLSATRGEILFDLREVKLTDNRPAVEEDKINLTWTELAFNWLGLGPLVEKESRIINAQGKFTLISARNLSHSSAHSGARRSPPDGAPGELRKIYATAEGQLELRGLSVRRKIPLTLHFHYNEAAKLTAIPSELELTLRRAVRIPLSEYDIRPRDRKGHLVTEQLALLGTEVGKTIKITGKLLFRLKSEPSSVHP